MLQEYTITSNRILLDCLTQLSGRMPELRCSIPMVLVLVHSLLLDPTTSSITTASGKNYSYVVC
ncbi:unnamed protein product [Heligmosomoides polygyrus]|uniref:Ovule protein n=1 Tax=Heligmosomoides polygyrus TaxID=6339 RepID=A0A183GTX6_HELPZ|nr:unnamed protein product [Heligmosomoides polygyrus]